MIHYKSPRWQIFVSRPTSILKRDFLKWTYLSVDKIKGFKVSKVIAIGNDQEVDVFINKKEDEKNYQEIIKHYHNRKIEKIFDRYKKIFKTYQPTEQDLIGCLNVMKDIGPILIYSYYVERLADLDSSKRRNDLIELNGRLRDMGAKIIYPAYNHTREFLWKEYSNKLIDNHTIKELSNFLDKKEISRRKKFYIFFGTKKITKIYTGKEAENFLRQHKFQKIKNKKLKELKGLPACFGKVKGRVKVVAGLADIKDCAGKIVVSRETIIEYTPYLKKAIGLITDLGGISCHAATIAREFKIPCIVGTKFATQIFNNGDMVEIDSEKGIVKKLIT